MLENLFSSKNRVKILELFLLNSDNKYFLREIARLTKCDFQNIHREIKKLEDIGLLISSKEGNLKYYSVNKKFIMFPELKNIFFKILGADGLLKEKLRELKNIKYAFIYGSYAKSKETKDSDIDLIIVGSVNMDKLNESMEDIEEKLNREINYSIYSEKEFKEKKKNKDGFLMDVLEEDKIILIGDKIGL